MPKASEGLEVRQRLVAPMPVLVFLLVSALAIGGFFVVRQSVASQQTTVLRSDASQLALVLQVAVQQITAELKPVAAAVSIANEPASNFATQAEPLTANPGTSVAIVRVTGGQSVVELAAGPNLRVGEVLPSPLASIASTVGSTTKGTRVFRLGTSSAIGFAVGPPFTMPGTAIVQVNVIHSSTRTNLVSSPYKDIQLALYATPTANPSQLIASSASTASFPAPVVRTYITITNNRWLIVVAAKRPLVGTWLRNSQWIVLGVGLLLAVFVGATTQIQSRRKSYAEALAAERTEELVASQKELVRTERLAAVGELATVVGHELRNPLGASTNALFLARQKLGPEPDPDLDRHLTMVEVQIGRAVALCEDLTSYVRQREPRRDDLQLRPLVDEVLETTPPPSGTDVTVNASDAIVSADASMMLRVVTNLVTNAYQAMPTGGSLNIDASTTDGYDVITFADSGQGIDPEVAEKLFNPFFTTKTEGTGLGLPIVQRIVEAHDGTISIDNGPSGGAIVTVRLPRTRKPKKGNR